MVEGEVVVVGNEVIMVVVETMEVEGEVVEFD